MKRRSLDESQQAKHAPTLEEQVYLEIQRTSQATARWIARALKAWGLSESQFHVLGILRGCGPTGLSITEIAERMVKHDPDLTRLLDRLVAKGLVEKSRDGRDRRVVRACITDAGLEVVKRASETARRTLVDALQSVGPRKLVNLAELLEFVRRGPDHDIAAAAASPTGTVKAGAHQKREAARLPRRRPGSDGRRSRAQAAGGALPRSAAT